MYKKPTTVYQTFTFSPGWQKMLLLQFHTISKTKIICIKIAKNLIYFYCLVLSLFSIVYYPYFFILKKIITIIFNQTLDLNNIFFAKIFITIFQ